MGMIIKTPKKRIQPLVFLVKLEMFLMFLYNPSFNSRSVFSLIGLCVFGIVYS